MYCLLLVLALSALSYSIISALNIPQPQTLNLSQSQNQASQNLGTHLGFGPECGCIKGSYLSSQRPRISDCEAAIKRLPKPFFHDSGLFHHLGRDDGFRLPQRGRKGTCHVLVEMSSGLKQDQGSWNTIRWEATTIVDRCGAEAYTGGWATQGNHNGIVVNVMKNALREVSSGADNRTGSFKSHRLCVVNGITGVQGLVLDARDKESTIREKRALPPTTISLVAPSIQNLTASTTPGLKCTKRTIFRPDRRARFDDCRIAIGSLPLILGQGFFHTGHTDDGFRLPVRKSFKICAVLVNLNDGVAGLEGKWLEVRDAALYLNTECRRTRKGMDLTGGTITAGVHAGLVIRLGNDGNHLGVGLISGLLGGKMGLWEWEGLVV